MRRALRWVASLVLLTVLAALGGGGWYYSDQVLPAPRPEPPTFDTEVLDADPVAGTVTFAATEGDLVELDTVGVLTPHGELLVDGPNQPTSGAATTRRATLLEGSWPRPGDRVATSVDAFVSDPATGLGLPFETVRVPSDLGDLPAWRVVPNGAETDTWVVVVHGRGADLAQGNRLLPTLGEVGLPSLTVSVRNDPGAPADPRGFGFYGEREWEDLEAAVDHLRSAEGAERVVLVGFSQGASTVLSFLRRSSRAEVVEAGVLISPLVSLQDTLVLQAQARDVPDVAIPSLLAATRAICSWRSGLDFDELEHVDLVDELPTDVPMLVTHGSADETVPIEPTRRFAAALPEQVIYEEYPEAGHVREWNTDRERFEDDLSGFLEGQALGADR